MIKRKFQRKKRVTVDVLDFVKLFPEGNMLAARVILFFFTVPIVYQFYMGFIIYWTIIPFLLAIGYFAYATSLYFSRRKAKKIIDRKEQTLD